MELEIVVELQDGNDLAMVCARHGITIEQADELMDSYGLAQCAGCGGWWDSIEIVDEYCPECRE